MAKAAPPSQRFGQCATWAKSTRTIDCNFRTLQVTSGSDTTLLYAGDTARYDANYPHAIRAPNGRAMAFLIFENS